MRKAKVVAIVCGMIASCLFGGFAVVEAATITLDDSSTAEAVYVVETPAEESAGIAATVTSIESAATATLSTQATTEPVMTEPETTAVITEIEEQTTTAIKSIAVVKPNSYAVPPVRETEAATEAPATKATVQTTVTTKTTTKATTEATVKEVTVPSIQTPQTTEAVYTNPPMPEQPAQTAAPQTQVETVTTTAPVTEPPTEAPTEPATQAPAVEVEVPSNAGISESDYILLCNAVAHEAGANSISVEEKAKVVEVIMNRVYSSNYPNTVYGVLTQKYQFSGSSSYVDLGTFSSKVTDKVKEAVDLYFADPSAFNDGYLSFTGDGKQNYFK